MAKNSVLDQLKYEVSKELGYINSGPTDFANFAEDSKYEISSELGIPSPSQEYRNYLNNTKFEVAQELGIPLQHGYNGDITSRDAGRIGGRIGGKIGGNMVRKMVEFAENHMKNSGGSI